MNFKFIMVLSILMSTSLFGVSMRMTANSDDAPISNSIGDMVFDGECLWVTTGNGISCTCDGGNTWQNYLVGKSFSALMYADGKIFAASSYDTSVGENNFPAGEGLYWSYVGDSISFEKLRPWQMVFIHDTSFFGMLSYELCIAPTETDTFIYSANWYGGLSRSSDYGYNWENVFWSYAFADTYGNTIPDSGIVLWDTIPEIKDTISDFVANNGYDDLFFAVAVDTAADPLVIFAGTASGIFAISDTQFVRSLPEDGLTGSWCVALAVQYLHSGERIIWASSRSTGSGSEFDGICFSTDDGYTWDTLAAGLICWNFAFCGDTAFFPCEQGFYRSVELDSVEKIDIYDSEQDIELPLDQMISATVANDVLWIGSDFGIAYTTDGCGCENFRISLHRQSTNDEDTYAFPSPFSPYQHGTMFFVFNMPTSGSAKLEILDFNMDKLYTTTENFNKGEKEMFQWNGLDDDGKNPANGIYFYRITLPDGTQLWGKFAYIR